MLLRRITQPIARFVIGRLDRPIHYNLETDTNVINLVLDYPLKAGNDGWGNT